jgi:hypothetical protein
MPVTGNITGENINKGIAFQFGFGCKANSVAVYAINFAKCKVTKINAKSSKEGYGLKRHIFLMIMIN